MNRALFHEAVKHLQIGAPSAKTRTTRAGTSCFSPSSAAPTLSRATDTKQAELLGGNLMGVCTCWRRRNTSKMWYKKTIGGQKKHPFLSDTWNMRRPRFDSRSFPLIGFPPVCGGAPPHDSLTTALSCRSAEAVTLFSCMMVCSG